MSNSMQQPPVSSAHRVLRGSVLASAIAVLVAGLGGANVATAQTTLAARSAAASHASTAFWRDAAVPAQRSAVPGAQALIQATRYRALTLDRTSLSAAMAQAPLERSSAARASPVVIALPDPAGGWQRFSVVEAPVMEAGLAAKHPHIKTYAGRGIDDPTATLRISTTQLGVHASVRSRQGNWYLEPYAQADESLYASYWRTDVPNRVAPFTEAPMLQPQLSLQRGRFRSADTVQVMGVGFAPNAQVTITVRLAGEGAVRQTLFATATADGTLSASFTADPWLGAGSYQLTAGDGKTSVAANYQVVPEGMPLNAAVGSELRTHRLALVTDPAYATFHGAANVTAAKITLMTRVNQVYEDDLSIRMVLIAATDTLNLNTVAQATGTNGPCGGAACFSTAQVASCGSSGLDRNRIVAGLLAGAGNFDVGHLALGGNGGGIAQLGAVGLDGKARGCTGINPPTGDVWAIDFVAHELGHQYAGNHTFNGTLGNCSGGNRNANNSVEPGSGTSVMAYAGICGNDNTQANSDPYFSQRSFDEITTHTSAAEQTLNEIQQAALTAFTVDGQQFQLRYSGANSVPIVRGTNFTAAGVKAAIEAIAGWPAGGTVTVSNVSDNAFTLTYGGTLAGNDVPNLGFVNCAGGCSGYVSDIVKGGATTRRGTVTATGNNPPVVTAPAAFTIPVRTPFALTGSATDLDGDAVTYMWEQNDRGAATGTSLVNNTKTNGPLFRQFGTASAFNASIYNPPGQNQATTNPTRVFPDLAQVLANNTNAETGSCGTIGSPPTAPQRDCLSEFLPTVDYIGFGANAGPARLNLRLTARDNRGGVNSVDTVLTLAPAAGPFLVIAPNSAGTFNGTTATVVEWSVAGTDLPPVSAANVKITLSTDGGLTYPVTLVATTPNTGSRSVVLPNVASTTARIKVEAVGNVFFDVSNANFTIKLTGDLNLDGSVTCADVAIVKAAFGTSTGQPGFNPVADVNNDGKVNIKDLAYVTQRLPAGTSCS